MKKKLIIALFALIAGHVLVPNFKSITHSATLKNAQGEEESCRFNWGGIGYGKSLSDGKFENCITEKKKKGFLVTSNETVEKDQSLISWLLFSY